MSMVPAEHGAVSGGFLMRLLKIAILVGASASVKAELVMRAGRQLDEVSVRDLVLYRWDEKGDVDLGMAEAVVDSFLEGFRTRRTVEKEERGRMRRVARLFDEYLGAVAGDGELSVDKFIELAELVPEVAREEHDELYRAIDAFLEVKLDFKLVQDARVESCTLKLLNSVCLLGAPRPEQTRAQATLPADRLPEAITGGAVRGHSERTTPAAHVGAALVHRAREGRGNRWQPRNHAHPAFER